MNITLDSNFDHTSDSMLILAIEGTPDQIHNKLSEILFNMMHGEKPRQGIFLTSETTTQIITPVWNGKKY